MTDSKHRHAPAPADSRPHSQAPERVALAPDLRSMPDRAARAWAERMAARPLDGGEYAIHSESGTTYTVDPTEGTCTCPDATIRGETCKHLRRVAIEITTRRVPPPGCRRATCSSCGGEAFVPEDGDPPALCETCRLAAGDVVLDRETGDRLVVTAVTEQRADEVTVAATGESVAEYPTNSGYPDDDLVVEAVYLTDAAATDDPHRYSFPRSRLRRVDGTALVD